MFVWEYLLGRVKVENVRNWNRYWNWNWKIGYFEGKNWKIDLKID